MPNNATAISRIADRAPSLDSSARSDIESPNSGQGPASSKIEQAKNLLTQLYQEKGAEDVRGNMNEALSRKTPSATKVATALALVAIVLVSFSVGKYSVNPVDLIRTVWFHFANPAAMPDQNMDSIVFNIRLPRVLMAMLVGAALAAAGAAFQGMFKNPLTSPDLLGASAGASLGACTALLIGLPMIVVQISAFSGGIAAVAVTLWLSKVIKVDRVLGLVLAGILVSQLFQAGMSLVKYLADADDKLSTITFWLMGSFSSANNAELAFCSIPIIAGALVLVLQAWKLNVVSFGEDEARSMGVNVARTRIIVVAAATLVTSASVAVSGIVGWVGLVVPHMARALVGSNFKALLPASVALGAGFLLVVDDLARLIAPAEIPISILTAVIGVPFFVAVFRRNARSSR